MLHCESEVLTSSCLATGYDMEDAMILNKSAVERGLAHATMIKTETVDLSKESGNLGACVTISNEGVQLCKGIQLMSVMYSATQQPAHIQGLHGCGGQSDSWLLMASNQAQGLSSVK